MKTYLLDTLNRYKQFSETLDVKAILCNKSWWIFNNSDEKEIYIFQGDGTLIISYGGKVTNATWQYIPVNKSLIISTKDEAYMLHPAFIDEKIFALQQDGTNKFAFMIDENQANRFLPKTLTELAAYFEEKERQKIQEQQKRLLLEQENTHRKQIEALRTEAEKEWEKDKDSILGNNKGYIKYKKYKRLTTGLAILISSVFTFLIILFSFYSTNFNWLLRVLIIFPSWIFFCIISISLFDYFSRTKFDEQPLKQQYIDNYIQTHKKQ